MTVQLEIQTELEQKVSAKASAEGKSVEAYIQSLVEREIGPTPVQEEAPLTGAQKGRAFSGMASGFPKNLPVLNPEDITREKMYERE